MENKQFILELFNRLGEIRGKKALQKLVYLARIFGIETNYSYRFHYFGPYSDTLAQDLDNLLENNIVSIKPSSSYILISNSQIPEKNSIENFESIESTKINELIKYFGEMSPSELELFSTAYFIDRNEKYVFGNSNKEKIIQEIMKAKPKFTEMEIRKTYNQLKDWGFLFMHSAH